MDKHLEIKELAEFVSVTEDTLINWEIRGVKPRKKVYKRLRKNLFSRSHFR
ncbi:MAG: hypothetical protein KJ706_10665 [Candidatus Omnitrophica bacterium]|nr:hypothetical protein [Candidatus Omnitrophota bacterium]